MKLIMENWRKFLKEDYDRQRAEERKISAVGDDEYLTDRNLKSLLNGTYKIVGPLKGIKDKDFDDDPDEEYEYFIVQDDYNDPVFRGHISRGWGGYVGPYEFVSKKSAEEAVRTTILRYNDRQESDTKDLESLTPAQAEKLSETLEGYEKFINSIPMKTWLRAFGITPNVVKKQVASFARRDAVGELKINDSSGDFMEIDTFGLSPAQIPIVAAYLPILVAMAGFDISEQEALRGVNAEEFYWSKVIYFWAPKVGFLSPISLLKSATRFVKAYVTNDEKAMRQELTKTLGIESIDALEKVQDTQEEPAKETEEAPANRDENKLSVEDKLSVAMKALEKLEDKK